MWEKKRGKERESFCPWFTPQIQVQQWLGLSLPESWHFSWSTRVPVLRPSSTDFPGMLAGRGINTGAVGTSRYAHKWCGCFRLWLGVVSQDAGDPFSTSCPYYFFGCFDGNDRVAPAFLLPVFLLSFSHAFVSSHIHKALTLCQFFSLDTTLPFQRCRKLQQKAGEQMNLLNPTVPSQITCEYFVPLSEKNDRL